MNVGVNIVVVLEELVNMFSLLHEKGVMYIPKPKPGWMGGRADGSSFKLFQ